jgi:hypothetical protein
MRVISWAVIAGHLVTAMAASAGTIDVVLADNRFGTIDSSSGAYTPISTILVSEAAGIAAGLTSLYVEDIYSNLLSIDPRTGVATLVGNSGLNLSVPAFGGGTGGLFLLDTSSNLYSVSANSGQAALIGSTGLGTHNFTHDTSLSWDGSSLLYTATDEGGIAELYRINTATAKATDLGSTGVKNVSGSAFVNGQLDLFQYGRPTNYLYSAPDGSTEFTRGAELGAAVVEGGVLSSTPEPGAFVLGLAGTVMLILGWRKRRAR